METPQLVVAVLIIGGNGTVLLGRDANSNQWTLPKGAITKFQPTQEVAKIAVLETTGIPVNVTGSLFITEEIVPPDTHNVYVITLGQTEDKQELEPMPRADVFSEVRWVGFNDLQSISADIDPVTADAITKFGLYLQAKRRSA